MYAMITNAITKNKNVKKYLKKLAQKGWHPTQQECQQLSESSKNI